MVVCPMRPRTFALFLDYAIGEYQEELRAGVELAARACGAELLTVCGRAIDAQPAREGALNRVYELMDSRRVTAGIIAGAIGTRCSGDALERLAARLAPMPLCSIGVRIPGVPALAVNDRRAMRSVMEHIVSHGCRRIAFIRGPETSQEAEQRYGAYMDCLRDHGLAHVDALVATGTFNVPTGAAAMERILERGERFDAVVAANDNMALGAAEMLKRRGIQVPHQVLVGGFDDFPLARYADPPLTTVRQPVQRLGQSAVETLLHMLDGKDVPELVEVQSELVLRKSCGCSYKPMQGRVAVIPRSSQEGSATDTIRNQRTRVEQELREAVRLSAPIAFTSITRLIDALDEELCGSEGRFLQVLEGVLDDALQAHEPVEEFHPLIAVLRAQTAGDSSRATQLDQLWHAASVAISIVSRRAEGRQGVSTDLAALVIREAIARLSSSLTHDTLKAGLVELLPAAKVSHSLVALYDDADQSKLRFFFGTVNEKPVQLSDAAYDAWKLTPPGWDPEGGPLSLVVQPLTFQTEQLGVLLLESGASNILYDVLREQISASLKAALLHQSVVHEAALRQRAERAQLEGELRIAERIQTAILPSVVQVPWLSVAAKMVPAIEVGGDYYDFHATDAACWVGIGDVTGHGLRAGLVMLMIQSMVSSLLEQCPSADPASVVNRLNAALYRNVRERLALDDHATFSLFHVEASGRVTWAGAHEDVIVQRANGSCEVYTPAGTWIAARADISSVTRNQELTLRPGDRIILYTDGLIEAMDANKLLFGLERVISLIESHARADESSLVNSLVQAAQRFSVVQQDDITVVILRYAPRGA